MTAARPMVAGERANKALHLTPVNVALNNFVCGITAPAGITNLAVALWHPVY